MHHHIFGGHLEAAPIEDPLSANRILSGTSKNCPDVGSAIGLSRKLAGVRIPEHPATDSDNIRPPVTRCREAACFGYQS